MRPYSDFMDGEFKELRIFALNMLKYRCLIRPKTVSNYFDTEEGMNLILKSFTHKSFDEKYNYEFLEFYGDSELNLSVVEYIMEKFPHIQSVMWITRIKHNLISGKSLAKLGMKHGFSKFSRYGEKLAIEMEKYKLSENDIENCESVMKMYEDNIEAFCGAIATILKKYCHFCTVHYACKNFISSMLDELIISTEYNEVFDAVSRLKLVFDNKGWNQHRKTSINHCLQCIELNEESLKKYKKEITLELLEKCKIEYLYNHPKEKIEGDFNLLNIKDRWICFGYSPCKNTLDKKLQLYAVKTAGTKAKAKEKAAEEIINRLRRIGVTIADPILY